ncbi:MAG TPA: terminase small subunit [Candidatus Nanoarchaeia archaeon]
MTLKQRLFIKHYLPTMGVGAEAARRAGYSVRSAKELAYRNMQNPSIATRINEILREAGLD